MSVDQGAHLVPRTFQATVGGPFQELAPGTKVELPDRSGRNGPPLRGTIMSTNMDGMDELTRQRLPTYVI
eukprot:scaffold614046_cov51-Prasinocladus_malaysianus.AAC.1